mgnify:CR=1 FL=1
MVVIIYPVLIKKSDIVINSTRDETELNINYKISDRPFRINSTIDVYLKKNGYDFTFLKSLPYLAIVLLILIMIIRILLYF